MNDDDDPVVSSSTVLHFHEGPNRQSPSAGFNGVTPTWSVAEARRQFEQISEGARRPNGIQASTSFGSRDVRSFGGMRLNDEGPSSNSRAFAENADYRHRSQRQSVPSSVPLSYNLQRSAMRSTPTNDIHTVAKYYPTERSNNYNVERVDNVRLIESAEVEERRNDPAYLPDYENAQSPEERRFDDRQYEQRHSEPTEGRIESSGDHNNYKHYEERHPIGDRQNRSSPIRPTTMEPHRPTMAESHSMTGGPHHERAVLTVTETDILDDAYSDAEPDDIMAECAEDGAERGHSMNCEFSERWIIGLGSNVEPGI